MNVVILGCSYRTAPVGVRERLAFTDEQVGRALDRLSACPGREVVLLSTCNRVELYLGYPGEGKEDGQELTDFLADFHGLPADLSDADCAATEKAFSRFQNQFLHGPIRALTEETHAGAASGNTLAEALLKLFRLPD